MKKLFILFGFLIAFVSVGAQTNVQIGTSTSNLLNSNTAGGDPGPMFRVTAGISNSKHHYTLTNAELAAAGLPTGSIITAIAFHKGSSTGSEAPHLNNFELWLKNSAATQAPAVPAFFSQLIQGATLAYTNNAQFVPSPVGFVNFPLTTPFVYTGGTLEVAANWQLGTPGYSSGSFNWSGNTVADRTISGNSASVSDTLSNLRTNRPTIRITYVTGAACNTTPTAGQATASLSSRCFGNTFALDLNGHNFESGFTYQWQTSTDNINFLNIPGATSLRQPVSQNNNPTYYRCVVSCGANSANSTSVLVGAQNSMAGSYSLNPSLPASATNFTSFTALAQALNCAFISNNVTINIASGTYTGNFVLNNIVPTSGAQVLITSATGIADNVIFTATDGNVLTITNSSNITFNNLSFIRNSAPGVRDDLMSIGVNNTAISVLGCKFKGLSGSISVDNRLISVIGNANTTISNSSFTDGYYGIWGQAITGPDTIRELQIIGNTFTNIYLTPINVVGQNRGTQVLGNTIINNLTAVGSGYAINMTNSLNFTVANNQASGLFGTAAVFLSNCNGDSLLPNRFYNNAFSVNLTSATARGIWVQTNTSGGNDWLEIYHNSMLLGINSSSTTQNGLLFVSPLLASTAQSINRLILQNNSISAFSTAATGLTPANLGSIWLHAPYLLDTNVFKASNNNWHFPTAVRYGYLNSPATAYATLANFQAASAGNELNTIEVNPLYTSSSDLRPSPASLLRNAGRPVVFISTDIIGNTRSLTSPTIGAYEVQQSANNAALMRLLSPNQVQQANSTVTVGVRIQNLGSAPLTSLSLNYQFNNGPVVTQTFSGNLVFLDSVDFNFTQTMLTPALGQPVLKVWTSAPNGSTDSDLSNDTITLRLCIPIATGTYTAGLPGNDYASVDDLINHISCSGIAGTVIVNVQFPNNLRNSRLEIPIIPGASGTNHLILDGGGDTISVDANTNFKYVVLMNGSEYVTLRNFVIRSTSTEFGVGILLQNGANNNRITKNLIDLSTIQVIPVTNAANNAMGIVSSGSFANNTTATQANNNLVDSNTIIGGHMGIRFNGASGSQGAAFNQIIGNLIRDFGATGVHLSQTFGTVVAGNNIHRTNRVITTTFQGINLEAGSFGSSIHSNRIHNSHTAATSRATAAFGIRLATVNPSDSIGLNRIYNNLVYELNSDAGTNAVLLNNVSFADVVFNTFDMSSSLTSNGDSRGIFLQGAISNIRFLNNNVAQTRNGIGSKQAIGIENTSAALLSNNNNLFVNAPAGIPGVGLLAAINYPTLASWRAAGSGAFDPLSTSVNPNLVNPVSFDFTPQNILLNGAALSIPYVTNDINGNPRNANFPDVGAYEFSVAGCAAPIQLAVDTVTLNSATLRWLSTNNLSWNIEYGPTGFTQGTGTIIRGITSKPYTLSNLAIFTCYDVYIQDSCVGQTSNWSGPINFCTRKDIDLKVNAVVSPVENSCTALLPFQVEIRNMGDQAVSSYTVRMAFSGPINGFLQQGFFTPLQAGASTIVSLGSLLTDPGGLINFRATVSTANDRDASNDTLDVSRFIRPFLLPVIVTNRDTVCVGGPATLWNSPTSGAQNIGWFNAQGAQIGTGDTLVTSITQSTTISARALGVQTYAVGPADTTFGNAQAFSEFTVGNNAMILEVLKPIRITRMKMYPNRSGNVALVIRDNVTNTLVLSQNILISQSSAYAPVVVNVDISLNPGVYRMSPTNNQTAGGMLFNNGSAVYPYSIPGIFNITGSTASNQSSYYYFYDLRVEYGSCTSPLVNKSLIVQAAPNAAFVIDQSASPFIGFNAANTTNATTYNWSFGDGAVANGQQASHFYTANGNYNVRLIATGNCGSDTLVQNVVISGLSVHKLNAVNNFKVYPNPNTGLFNISFEQEAAKAVQLIIRDMTGRNLYETTIDENRNQVIRELDLQELAAGVYYISIESGNRRSMERMVITRR